MRGDESSVVLENQKNLDMVLGMVAKRQHRRMRKKGVPV